MEDIASLKAEVDNLWLEIKELYEENRDLRNRLESAVERLRTAHFQEKTLLDKIERITVERDEARRMYCEVMEKCDGKRPDWVAEQYGWDCFKEDN